MLEERGWRGGYFDRARTNYPEYVPDDSPERYQADWAKGGNWESSKLSDSTQQLGPTPSIALGKCLLEVIGKEKLEDLDLWIGEDIEEEIKRQFPNG